MPMSRWMHAWIVIAAAGLLTAAPDFAQAQSDYPNRTIKIVVPVGAGSGADLLPRVVAKQLEAKWHQPVVVENLPGAANNIGAEAVAKSKPDGYTLLAAPPTALVINPSLYTNLPYNANAFVPVTIIASVPNVLVASPKLPVTSLDELIAYAKAHPDRLRYGSSGIGTTPHLAMEQLKTAAGIKITHISYRSLPATLAALLGGEIDLMFDNLTTSLDPVERGNLKALGIGSEKRNPALPDVPAIGERFFGFQSVTWFAVVAPPKTPAAIADKLSRTINEILKLPDVAVAIRNLQAVPVGGTPEETAAYMKLEAAHWSTVVAAAGVKPRALP